MKPVKQTKLYAADGPHAGNCLAACIASLFDLPLWMVPQFDEMFVRGDWRERMQAWSIKVMGAKLAYTDDHAPEKMPEFYIASGPSPRGVHHSVIYSKGALVHDPHPSGDGIRGVDWTWHAQPTQEERHSIMCAMVPWGDQNSKGWLNVPCTCSALGKNGNEVIK